MVQPESTDRHARRFTTPGGPAAYDVVEGMLENRKTSDGPSLLVDYALLAMLLDEIDQCHAVIERHEADLETSRAQVRYLQGRRNSSPYND